MEAAPDARDERVPVSCVPRLESGFDVLLARFFIDLEAE